MVFTAAERAYLEQQRLCRLATIGPDQVPNVRPLGFRLNADGTIDIGGPNHRSTRRFRNALARPRVSLVVDDMTPDVPGAIKPGMGRGVEVRGYAEAIVVDEPPSRPIGSAVTSCAYIPSGLSAGTLIPRYPTVRRVTNDGRSEGFDALGRDSR